jgi:hypothetical protein
MRMRTRSAERLATPAAQQIGAAHRLLQLARHFLNDTVADAVAMRIVDVLEMIDVDHQAGQGAAGAHRMQPGAVEGGVEGAAVECAGEWVARGQALELEVLLLDLLF